jgi:predicted alpha/beta-fold hydrolase
MEYIYKTYCKPFNRKVFALGCSMGGNVLINSVAVQGNLSFIDAVCVISVPMKMWEVEEHMETACYGLYNKKFGNSLRNIIVENKDVLRKNHLIN